MNTEAEEKEEIKSELIYIRTVLANPERRYACRPAIQLLSLGVSGFIPRSIKLGMDEKTGVYIEKLEFEEDDRQKLFVNPRYACEFLAGIAASKDYGALITDEGVPTMESMIQQYVNEDEIIDASVGRINPAFQWVEDCDGEEAEDIIEVAGFHDHWLDYACTEQPGLVQLIIESFMASDGLTGDQFLSLVDSRAPEILNPVHHNIMERFKENERLEGAR